MALTAAERAKRYRDKLKQNPHKHEVQRQKQLKRLKERQKKIADLSEEEKTNKRKIWREQKRKQKEKKKTQPKTISKEVPKQLRSEGHSLKIKYSNVCKNYSKALKSIRILKSRLDCIRKRLSRAEQKHDNDFKLLKNENDKLKARNELMEISLRTTYSNCKKTTEKRLLKQVVTNKEGKIYKHAGSVLGLKGTVRVAIKNKPHNKKVKKEIEKFFIRDDISRSTSGKRECKTKGKKKLQIRYTVNTLVNLYAIYKSEGGKCSFTTFFRYKPFFVISPSANRRDTCLCIKHSNTYFLFAALKSKGVISQNNLDELITAIACNTKSNECMFNKCAKCKIPRIEYNKEKLDCEVAWFKWLRVNHEYEKSGKKHVTKKTTKQQINGTVRQLIAEFENALPLFKTHVFTWKHQQNQYQMCINNITDDEIVIICDFSENYDCKFAEEVQAIHFGASKNAITLHTGVIYFKDKAQSFVTVSDNSCHEPRAIWAHLFPVIKFAKNNYTFSIMHVFSDGPSSQYRQKKNFYLLSLFTAKLKLLYSTWSFSESGHGKSVADGIGGSVKRQLDKKVAYGLDVTNGLDAHNIIQESMKSVKSFYVTDNDIENVGKLIPENISVVPGTLRLHQIISQRPNQIKFRQLSCFCGDLKGLCSCYCPKNHYLLKNQIQNETDQENVSKNERYVDFIYKVNREIDSEVMTGEKVTKNAVNDDISIMRCDRVDKNGYDKDDITESKGKTCDKTNDSAVMRDERDSKNDYCKQIINKRVQEMMYLHDKDRKIIRDDEVKEKTSYKCEDRDDIRDESVNEMFIYDTLHDSSSVNKQVETSNATTKLIMDNIDDIPCLTFPLDDIVLQPFDKEITYVCRNDSTQNTRPDPKCILPSTSKNSWSF